MDVEIFKQIAFCLGQIYAQGVNLGGILYLHRITDIKIAGSTQRSFDTVKAICGPTGAKFTTLVTTMWDNLHVGKPQYQEACWREGQLCSNDRYWGWTHGQDSRSSRWMGTQASAHSILSELIRISDYHGSPVLQLQRELIDDRKDPDDTQAGQELLRHHVAELKKLRRELRNLHVEERKAYDEHDSQTLEEIRSQKRELESQVEVVTKAEGLLRESVETVFEEKIEEFLKMFSELQKQNDELSREIDRLKGLLEPFSRQTTAVEGEALDVGSQEKKVEQQLVQAKKMQMVKRNAIALMGMFGGAASIVAGGATGTIPIAAAGVALFGQAGMKLDFSKRGRRDTDERWVVDDYDG